MAYQTFLDNGQTHLPYLMSASLIQVVPEALKPDDFNARQLLHLPISFGNGHNEVDGPVRQICCRYTTLLLHLLFQERAADWSDGVRMFMTMT